jgi:hypothetical protein
MKIIVDRLTYPDGLNAAVKQSRLIKRTIKDVCRLIMTDEVQASIKLIRVRVLYRMKKNCYGICEAAGRGHYIITVGGRLHRDLLVATLAHEVAHVNQFAEGRLDSDSSHFWWYGDYSEPKLYNAQNHTHQEYLAWPWEREARSIENSYMKILSSKK